MKRPKVSYHISITKPDKINGFLRAVRIVTKLMHARLRKISKQSRYQATSNLKLILHCKNKYIVKKLHDSQSFDIPLPSKDDFNLTIHYWHEIRPKNSFYRYIMGAIQNISNHTLITSNRVALEATNFRTVFIPKIERIVDERFITEIKELSRKFGIEWDEYLPLTPIHKQILSGATNIEDMLREYNSIQNIQDDKSKDVTSSDKIVLDKRKPQKRKIIKKQLMKDPLQQNISKYLVICEEKNLEKFVRIPLGQVHKSLFRIDQQKSNVVQTKLTDYFPMKKREK